MPYYRYRLGEVEAARGNHAAAVAAFHSLEDRSLGDLLYKPTMCLAMAQSLEAMGETDEAAAYYAAAAGWWAQAEPAFADRLAQARAGLGRIGAP